MSILLSTPRAPTALELVQETESAWYLPDLRDEREPQTNYSSVYEIGKQQEPVRSQAEHAQELRTRQQRLWTLDDFTSIVWSARRITRDPSFSYEARQIAKEVMDAIRYDFSGTSWSATAVQFNTDVNDRRTKINTYGVAGVTPLGDIASSLRGRNFHLDGSAPNPNEGSAMLDTLSSLGCTRPGLFIDNAGELYDEGVSVDFYVQDREATKHQIVLGYHGGLCVRGFSEDRELSVARGIAVIERK